MAQDQNDVVVVTTGMDAMKEISANEFDLIFLSLNLSSEDGVRFCSHLRSNERTRSTPIIMLGQEEDLDKIAHGLEIGAHDYLLRPLDKNEMMARCRTQIRRKRFQDKLRANYEISLSMALTDALTGLYNRRYFEVHMQKMLQSSRENRKPLGFLYMDIDHFKSVNDTYGHQVGDEILKGFAERVKDALRSFDLVARLGGEEFVAILPDTTPDVAYAIGERLRKAIAATPFPCSNADGQLVVTSSFGGIVLTGNDLDQVSVPDVIKRADAQLYEAKHNGRNCVYFEGKGRL